MRTSMLIFTLPQLVAEDVKRRDPNIGLIVVKGEAVILQTVDKEVIIWFKDTETTVKRRTVVAGSEVTLTASWHDIFLMLVD